MSYSIPEGSVHGQFPFPPTVCLVGGVQRGAVVHSSKACALGDHLSGLSGCASPAYIIYMTTAKSKVLFPSLDLLMKKEVWRRMHKRQ